MTLLLTDVGSSSFVKEDPSQLEAVTCVGPGGLVMVINN